MTPSETINTTLVLPTSSNVPQGLAEASYINGSPYYRYLGTSDLYTDEELLMLSDLFQPTPHHGCLYYLVDTKNSGDYWHIFERNTKLEHLKNVHLMGYSQQRLKEDPFREILTAMINDDRRDKRCDEVPIYEPF